jgi:hypothetical protein
MRLANVPFSQLLYLYITERQLRKHCEELCTFYQRALITDYCSNAGDIALYYISSRSLLGKVYPSLGVIFVNVHRNM